MLDRSEEMPSAAVSAADAVQPDGGDYQVLIPLANTDRERDLVTLACAIASQRGGTVDAVPGVTVPPRPSLEQTTANLDALEAEVARVPQAEYDADVTLPHVTDSRSEGDQFLEEWAAAHDLSV